MLHTPTTWLEPVTLEPSKTKRQSLGWGISDRSRRPSSISKLSIPLIYRKSSTIPSLRYASSRTIARGN